MSVARAGSGGGGGWGRCFRGSVENLAIIGSALSLLYQHYKCENNDIHKYSSLSLWAEIFDVFRCIFVVVSAVDQKKEVNSPYPVSFQVTGYTPLMYAVKENKVAIAEKLLDLGCLFTDRGKVRKS